MNKISILLLSFFSLLVSCNKDDFNNTADNVGISKVTYFPSITVKGASIIAVAKGSAYVEPGVTAKAGTADVAVTTAGNLNTGVSGIYTLNYSAVNTDGFVATASRTVAVYSTAVDAAAHDLSGTYVRSNGVLSTWTKLAPGLYSVFNPGGAAGTNVTVVVTNSTGFAIDIPEQIIGDGSKMSSTDEVYTDGAPATYAWKIVNRTYGTALRTFKKQ